MAGSVAVRQVDSASAVLYVLDRYCRGLALKIIHCEK